MSPADPLEVLGLAQRNDLESLLMEFEQSWNPDSIAKFAQRLKGSERSFSQLAIVELVKIDLQRRWASGKGRLLDEYLSLFPTLGNQKTVDASLILSEWEARQSSDPAPDLASYESRFPKQFESLKRLVIEMEESGTTVAKRKTETSSSQASIDTSRIAELKNTRVESKQVGVLPDLPIEFGRYRILKELGSGAMGKVYLAHDSQLDRQVALKTPSFSGDRDDEMVTRFYREARAAAKIQHRNICPIYDVGKIEGRHFISMAFVKGRCMSEFIKPGSLPPQRTSAVLVHRLALALAEAHQHNVVHRDLKPANIMIDLKKEPVVMDFGLARQTDAESRVTQSGMAVGTPAYMSPEQIRGDSNTAGPSADIYALGVILYEMLTGQIPFRGQIAKVVYSIIHDQPTPISDIREGVDPELERICTKMMAKDQSDRYLSMQAVAKDLKDYLKGRTAPANPNKTSTSRTSGTTATKNSVESVTETGALNAFFATQAQQDPTNTIVEPIASAGPAVSVQAKPKASSRRGGGWTKWIALGLGGFAILGGVIIYLSDGSRIEIADGTQASVEIDASGGVKNVTTLPESNKRAASASANANSTTRPNTRVIPTPNANTASIPSANAGPSFGDSDDGFVPLFPDGDLSGWSGLNGFWSWENGELVGRAGFPGQKRLEKNTVLCSDKEYQDFELRFDVKLENPTNGRLEKDLPNSGVQFRSKITDRSTYTAAGPQADMGGRYWGGIWGEGTVGLMHEADAGLVNAMVRKGDWNEYHLSVKNKKVTIKVNGFQTVDKAFPVLQESGILGFQLHRGRQMTARFRNVRIREPRAPLIAVQNAGAQNEGQVLTINKPIGTSALAVSPDGRHIASAETGNPAQISIWNSKTAESVSRFQFENPENQSIWDLWYSPDGTVLGCMVGQSLYVMDSSTGKQLSKTDFTSVVGVVRFPKRPLAFALQHEEEVHRKNRNEVPQRLKIWNYLTNEVLCDEMIPIQVNTALSWPSVSPDESFVTFGWGHYYVRYDLSENGDKISLGKRSTFERLHKVRGSLVFSPDSRYAAGSIKSTECMGVFLDVQTSKSIHQFDPQTARQTNRGYEYGCNLAITADGTRLVSADHNGRVTLWGFPSGEFISELGRFHVEGQHHPPKVAVTKDDRVVVAGDYSDSRITIQSLPRASEMVATSSPKPSLPQNTPPAAPQSGDGWTSLFNGRDLSGWRQVHHNDVWRVVDGCLESRPVRKREKPGGWLATEESFMNFELSLEYYLPENGNSGIFLRMQGNENTSGANQLEIQLLDDAGSKHSKVKKVGLNGAVFGVIPPSPVSISRANRWNTMTVKALSSKITVAINDVTVVNADLNQFRTQIAGRFKYSATGPIGLQWYGNRVRFRNLRIRPLN